MTDERLAGVTEGQQRRRLSAYMRRKNGEHPNYLPVDEELKRAGLV